MGRHEAQFVSRAPRSQLEHCLESRTIVSVNTTADRAIGNTKGIRWTKASIEL